MTDTYGPRDFVGYGPDMPDAKWPGGAKIAISMVLNYEEGSELCPENGDKMTEIGLNEMGPGLKPMRDQRDVNMESLYEYGSRAGIWRILNLFDEFKIKLTAYAVGMALEKNPKVAPAFEAGNHEIASHGYRHIESEGGSRSRGLVAQAFKAEGATLKYYSDDYSDDLPHWVPNPAGDGGLLIIPYSLVSAFITADQYAQYLIDTFDELYREGVKGKPKMMSIGLHCRVIGKAGRIGALRKFFEHCKKHEGVWFATREEIADHWIATHPYQA
ncbi:carbohydrate esterase family 4 protein [Pseudohyphozyma bogoriensis]|nr:carbohydrate esterase family 4 protein [Pseudohyphozyma bogoriensis]